jgi:hypothetical protein
MRWIALGISLTTLPGFALAQTSGKSEKLIQTTVGCRDYEKYLDLLAKLERSADKARTLAAAVGEDCRFLKKGDEVLVENITSVGVCYRPSWAPHCYWSLPAFADGLRLMRP